MLAFAMMASIRHSANIAVPPKGSRAKPCDGSASPHDPLVDSGNPPYRHQDGPATHAARAYHRMVGIATSPSSRRTTSADESKNATAMLSRSHVGKRADDLLRVFAYASIQTPAKPAFGSMRLLAHHPRKPEDHFSWVMLRSAASCAGRSSPYHALRPLPAARRCDVSLQHSNALGRRSVCQSDRPRIRDIAASIGHAAS